MREYDKLIPEKLFEKLANGDHTAFRQFYDIIYPSVYQYIRCFIHETEDVKDVVSEVFYIVWKKRELLPSVNNIKSWIFIVSRNEAYRFLKQKERYDFISIDEMPVELEINSADDAFIDEEMLAVYRDAVNVLPERCKLIFLLAKENNFKYREIAEILGITEGTVAQQMNNAIRKITEVVKRRYTESNHKM